MKLCLGFFIIGLSSIRALGVADVITSYAKVAVNDNTKLVKNVSTSTPSPKVKHANETSNDEEEDIPEYEDFDDADAVTERNQQTGIDSQSMLKYVNGFVNLLALMYQFSGNSKTARPQSPPDINSRPRTSGGDPLADSINSLAEDRYNPTTATKKFKQQGAYASADNAVPYKPYSPPSADSYSSSGGKTSYDSDASQYMIKNPTKIMSFTLDDKNPSNSMDSNFPDNVDMTYKNPMTDYMTQNNPVEIQKSYSYEIPQPPVMKKESWHQPANQPEPTEPNHYAWKMNPMMKQPADDQTWGSNPPNEEKEEEPRPVYHPWMSNSPKKPKPAPPPPSMYGPPDDEDVPPSHPKNKHQEDHHYYPWLSQSPPKEMKKPMPPPMEEEPENDDASSWGMKPPGKSKPPPDVDITEDSIPPYPYFPDHDHGIVYHDDHHHHHHDEEEDEKHMKDEDRESKRPYTYYHLGRKLWYIPLLFSLYFIVYIGSLILKSLGRHKVQFPEKLWELHENHHHHDDHRRRSRKIDSTTQRVYNGIENVNRKLFM